MNDKQRNRLRMFKTVRTHVTENEPIWSGIAAIADVMTAYSGKIDEIDLKVTAQGAPLGGYTQNKYQLRTAMETETLLVAGATEAYANSINDPILLSKVKLEETDLEDASEQTVDDIAERVRAAAEEVLPQLAPYGISAVELSVLADAITAFEAAKSVPDSKKAERAGHTETLEPLFAQATALLDGQLDVLMRRYKTSDPAFHAGYEAARVIIDLRGPGDGDDEDPVPDPDPDPDPGP